MSDAPYPLIGTTPGTASDGRPPRFSDETLALTFAAQHANALAYVAAWGRWFIWNGPRWKHDKTLKAYDLVRAVCRAASAECDNSDLGKAIASAHTVAAVEKLAKADRRLAAATEQWDSDPWLLNTPGGTVDLRTGQMQEHRPQDYCTKITAVSPGGDCPLWHGFLERVTGGNSDLIGFLRRMAGYSLTGSTRDHALFFLFGQGGNGKSVFVSAMAGAMGDYAESAPIETFITNVNDRHPTEIARLHGARLVTASEAEMDRHWNESRIKALTGGDRVTARFMQKDFFDYTPQFKLLIMGNYKPSFRGVNEAMRRRLHLVSFDVTIPKDEIDQSLPEKLREEWPGILAWMITGCLEWQREGLAPPTAVRDATASYLNDEDTLGHWLDACSSKTPGGWTGTTDLYASWSQFARGAGEEPGSQKVFVDLLQGRGFSLKRTRAKRGFSGLILRPKGGDDA